MKSLTFESCDPFIFILTFDNTSKGVNKRINWILGNCDSVPNLASPSNITFPSRLKLRRASVSLDGATCASFGNNSPLSRQKHRSTYRPSIGRQGSIQVIFLS